MLRCFGWRSNIEITWNPVTAPLWNMLKLKFDGKIKLKQNPQDSSRNMEEKLGILNSKNMQQINTNLHNKTTGPEVIYETLAFKCFYLPIHAKLLFAMGYLSDVFCTDWTLNLKFFMQLMLIAVLTVCAIKPYSSALFE